MDRVEGLFEAILADFDRHGILSQVVLIGSWCLPIYNEYFEHPPEIPALRTVDLDFLIPDHPPIRTKVDIPNLLKEHGFVEAYDQLSGIMKFLHPELEVEFMVPERGKGSSKPYVVDFWRITAQRLRFMGFIFQFLIEVRYRGLRIRVPEPATFVLLKYLISTKRKDPEKRDRDISVAHQLGEYLISIPDQQEKLIRVFTAMPGSWQKTTLKVIEPSSKRLHAFLTGSPHHTAAT